mmetsp:Transcript_52214/g.117606  ORF Transcript_52214/g.117606 Transcript_52214/m.117606 type:complete len:591 (-) Transcript_52214:51-1823(-)
MEQGGVASGVDASLYPVAVLIDELRHDDAKLRLNSVRNLGTIATALGPERTCEELIPFLQEIIDDDDEVLIALAEQLGKGIPWVGGPTYAHCLMGPLEELCNVEEITVRDKATEAIRELVKQIAPEQVSRHVCALITRLATHDWFNSRISACALFCAAIPKVGEAKQDDLLKLYLRLCGDETPMVRRQAANVLGGIVEVLQSETMLSELFEVFEKLAKDEQDSVRILAINNCIAFGKLQGSEFHESILEVVKACAEDKSWRVRYVMADNIEQLCKVFQASALTTMVPLFLQQLSDQEVEVRMIASARISAVAAVNPTKDFLESLIPLLEKLTHPREQSQHVRVSMAGSILSLAPIFGAQLTVDLLMGVFLHLIRDESPEVRLKLVGTLGELSTVLGVEVLSQSLLPAIKDLGKDRQWRVRLAVLYCMPSLAQYLGETQFTAELSSLFAVWIVDPVYCVREATAVNVKRLSEILGTPWIETHIIPQMENLLSHKNYLYRISAMLCSSTLSEVGSNFLEKHLVPMVLKLAADSVPNVRFNAAKTIQAMHKACSTSEAMDGKLLPCLRGLTSDEDPDVKFFAKKALSEVGAQP